jgi:hypothetical protein
MSERKPTARQLSQLQLERDRPGWYADQLEKCRLAHEQGDKRSLAIAMALCLGNGISPPLWVVHAFFVGFEAMRDCKIASWDDVLGGNPRTDMSLRAAQRRRALVQAMVKWLEDHPPKRIDGELFEALGAELNVSAATAKDIYYEDLPASARPPSTRGTRTR